MRNTVGLSPRVSLYLIFLSLLRLNLFEWCFTLLAFEIKIELGWILGSFTSLESSEVSS